MINPYLEYRGVYGGGADDRVEQRGGTGGSSVRPYGSVNHIDELHMSLLPLRSMVSLLDGATSFSMLRGDSEIECLREELVDAGFDDDDCVLLPRTLPKTIFIL